MSSADDRKREQSIKLAETIKERERKKERRKQLEEYAKRPTIAKEARAALEAKDALTALKKYQEVLAITAKFYDTTVGKLRPNLFDNQFRTKEALMISAICFDLAKILDKLNTDSSHKDLLMYLNLYVQFSKGLPFQSISSQTLKKFINYTRGIRHEKDFINAQKLLNKPTCFVATAVYQDHDAPEVLKLRLFRDNTLNRTHSGRAAVLLYYIIGPTLSLAPKYLPGCRFILKKILDSVVKKLT